MKPLPDATARDEYDAVIVRTDYTDHSAWQEVVRLLTAKESEWTSDVHLVEDPAWAGVGVDEVVAAASGKELSVVFLADSITMRADHHAVLAVTTKTREDCESDEEWEYEIGYGREFRTVPAAVHEIHGNRELGNMDFQDFSGCAHLDPDRVFRGFV